MILEIILTSSVLILIIMLLRAFCRKSIKPTLRYALWLVVAVRLVMPFSLFSSNASVMNLFGRAGMVEPPAPSADISASAPTDVPNDTVFSDGRDDASAPENYSNPGVLPPLGQGYIDPIAPTVPNAAADPANQEDISFPASPANPADAIDPTEPTASGSEYAPAVQDNFPQQNAPEFAEAPAKASLKPTENQNTQPQTALDMASADNKQPSVSVSLSISLFGRRFEFQPWLVNTVKAVWLAVAAVMGLWFFGVNIAFSASLRKNRRALDVDTPLKVYSVPNLSSPCLFGFFRPAIYVNERAAQDESSLRFVLAHEYCHYRHGDMLWSLLRCVLLSVYWFNPLVWAAAYLSKRDCECACDEAAIKLLGEPYRIDYGKALVGMIPERRQNPRFIGVASTSMSGGKRAVRERVKYIAKKPKNTVIAVVLIIAVLAAAVGCTFTSADNDKEKDLPQTDIADTGNQPDKPEPDEEENTAKPDDSESASGMRIEKFDSSGLNSLALKDTKPFIVPIYTEHGVEDCLVYVKTDGDRLLGVSSFNPIGYGVLSVIESGDDYCYFQDFKSEQIYYYNVTTGKTTPLLPESYDGYSKQEFIDYFAELNSAFQKKLPDTAGDAIDYMKYWLFGGHVSSDGKWLAYISAKWTEDGKISAENHFWLRSVETGEEFLFDDFIASAVGDSASFIRLLPDNRLLVVNRKNDGTMAYYIVDLLTKEARKILQVPSGTYSCNLSDRYILTFDGDATVYDITNGDSHKFMIGVDDYSQLCLGMSKCEGDCLAVTPNSDVAYVIDLAHYKIEKYLPPDSRHSICIQEVCGNAVVFNVGHKSGGERFGSFVVRIDTLPEQMDYDADFKLYSRHVEYSSEEYQEFIPEVYDMTPIYEILGEEAAQEALAQYYKREMLIRQSTPPLYRLIKDTGVTREQLEAYNHTAENKLSSEVIEALYYPYDTMASKALIGRLSIFYDGKAYSLSDAIHYMYHYLPGGRSSDFREDISEYWTVNPGGGMHDIESANKVVKEYAELLNSGESSEDYPAAAIEYEKFYICDSSNNNKSQAIKIESCDLSTDDGAARWLEINRQNQTAAYYLPIKLGNRTVDCEIKTVIAENGKIADISYRTLSGEFRIFGEGTKSCYVYKMDGRSIYRFDIATAECTPILSLPDSGYSIEDPTHYEHIPRDSDKAGYPLQASPDGKWLLYRSDKWLKENTQPIEKYHTWLYNIETGEEILFDDAVIYVAGYEKQFEYLLADNKILVSAEEPDGCIGYSIVDIPTKKSEKILTVPANIANFVVSENYILYYEAPKDENQKAVMAVYDISDGSTHRFRFNNTVGRIYSWDCLGKCIAMRTDGINAGVIVMNLEDDSAVNLIIPENIEYGSMLFELVSDELVLIEEFASGYNDFSVNIAVWTGLEREVRDTSLSGRMYGRHVEYTAKEYQKFIPEAYDLTPIYKILGEEKASAAVADYYSLTCGERQALPPLYRLIHSAGITREQLKNYNQTAQNKLSDDVIEALCLDRTLASSEAVRVKEALLAETSLFYDGNAYSLNEAISANLPYDVKAEYLGRIEGYVRKNCSNHWINLVNQVKEGCDDAVAAASTKVGETIYSFDKTAVQGDKTADYRIDVVCTGKDGHRSSEEFSTTIRGEFELRAFDENGKQTGSVKLYSGSQGNATGLDTKNLSRAFSAITADNIIIFSSPNYIGDNSYVATIYGITFSGELFMYEIEDSDNFIYTNSNPGSSSICRISANTLIASDLLGYIRPNLEGDTPDTGYLHDSYSDYDIRQISFYQIDEENRRIIPKIFIDGDYRANIVDSVVSEQKPNATDPLYVMTSDKEAYVYYISDWLHPSEKSGIYYRKTVKDDNGEWHAEGETMRVKTQEDIAGWFKQSDGSDS